MILELEGRSIKRETNLVSFTTSHILKIMFSKKCKQHLKDVEEDGITHMCKALKVAIRLQLLVPSLIIHSLAPRFFTKTTTNVMNDILNTRKKN